MKLDYQINFEKTFDLIFCVTSTHSKSLQSQASVLVFYGPPKSEESYFLLFLPACDSCYFYLGENALFVSLRTYKCTIIVVRMESRDLESIFYPIGLIRYKFYKSFSMQHCLTIA